MATEIFTGVVIEGGWHTEVVVDAYWITLDTDPQSESGMVVQIEVL